MIPCSIFRLCLLFFLLAILEFQLSDNIVIFSSLGESITLPCGIPSIKSCSSVNWITYGAFGLTTQAVETLSASKYLRVPVGNKCSLQISHLELNDARLYRCDHGPFHSNVSLEILQISENNNTDGTTIELQCYLNTFKGFVSSCNHTGIQIHWLSGGDAQLNGDRFQFTQPSKCFSKLIIKNKKPTDHRRTWSCRLSQKATHQETLVSYTTTLQDGVEEVFAVAGESVSFSCGKTSSSIGAPRVRWELSRKSLTTTKVPSDVIRDTSVVISDVSALHSGNYQCLLSEENTRINTVRLHVLDVIEEHRHGQYNLSLTCLLTCATTKCDEDFDLTWTGSRQHGGQRRLTHKNTIVSTLLIPNLLIRNTTVACSVSREGVVMATKKWPSTKTTHAIAWLSLPLSLLLCAAVGGVCLYIKKNRRRDEGTDVAVIGMNHFYEDITEPSAEELPQQSQCKSRAVTTTDSFYDLLQAVN